MRKIVSMILALTMLFSLTVSASAANTTENGMLLSSATPVSSDTSENYEHKLYQAVVDEVNQEYGANYVITEFEDEITISPESFREKLIALAMALKSEQSNKLSDTSHLAARAVSSPVRATYMKTLTRNCFTYFQLTATAKYYYEGSGSNRVYYYSTDTSNNTVSMDARDGYYEYSFTMDYWVPNVRASQKFYDVTVYGTAWVTSGGIMANFKDVSSTFTFYESDLS